MAFRVISLGDLSATSNGLSTTTDLLPKLTTIRLRVYSQIPLVLPIVNILVYYAPIGDYHIIDYNGMNERITSEQTLRSSIFHRDVMARDGSLQGSRVVNAMQHIYSLKARAMRYVSVLIVPCHDPALEPNCLVGINAFENGMFWGKNMHASFALGNRTFLKVRKVA